MTIHVRAWSGDEITQEEETLQITISGKQDLQKLQALLNRSLNCAPEFGADWFAMSAKLEEFMIKNNIPRVSSF